MISVAAPISEWGTQVCCTMYSAVREIARLASGLAAVASHCGCLTVRLHLVLNAAPWIAVACVTWRLLSVVLCLSLNTPEGWQGQLSSAGCCVSAWWPVAVRAGVLADHM
jgi:hypothetical protein